MEIIDFDGFRTDPTVAYGGAAGQKQGIHMDGGLWMVKYPESTKEFRSNSKHLPSYTTSPLSEFIGSHVYESLRIPVHETLLGKRDGKIVVACRDFVNGGRLIDFAAIKNTVSDDALAHGTSSRLTGDYLSDVLEVIREAPIFEGMRDAALKRFWDMFVTDAFILNNDRNNGNWGLIPIGRWPELAPVFDNGQSFFNKKGASVMNRALQTPGAVWNNVASSLSFYLDDSGHAIKPFQFLKTTEDRAALAALSRFVERIDLGYVEELIAGIPEKAFDIDVMPDVAKEFYMEAAQASLVQGIVPAAEAQGIPVPDRVLRLSPPIAHSLDSRSKPTQEPFRYRAMEHAREARNGAPVTRPSDPPTAISGREPRR